MLRGFLKSHVKSQANSSHWTLPCQCVPSLGIFLLRVIILVGRHDALDWLKCIVGKTSFGTSTTVSSLASQDSDFITQTGDLGCVGGIVKGTLVIVCREQMMIHHASYGRDFTMMANVSWLCWTASAQTCAATKSFYLAPSQNNYPTQPEPLGIVWSTRR